MRLSRFLPDPFLTLDDIRFIPALLNCARTAVNVEYAYPEGFSGMHVTIDKIKEDDGRPVPTTRRLTFPFLNLPVPFLNLDVFR